MMKLYKGLIGSEIIDKYPSGYPVKNGYWGYVANFLNLEEVVSCAALFCPDFIEYDGLVYLRENVGDGVTGIPSCSSPRKNAPKLCSSSKQENQAYYNMVCLSEFFLPMDGGANHPSFDSEELLFKFAESLIFFWGERMKCIFPNKEFKFVVMDNGMFDEDGFCITFFNV